MQIFQSFLRDSNCLSPSQAWNVLALDGSNWQKIDLFNFQTDIEVRTMFLEERKDYICA